MPRDDDETVIGPSTHGIGRVTVGRVDARQLDEVRETSRQGASLARSGPARTGVIASVGSSCAIAHGRRLGREGSVFDKVLIANRGEIAVRIARTCRDLGIATVAVYSNHRPRRDSTSVSSTRPTGASLRATPPSSVTSTRCSIVEIAHRAAADAVHPGYGFLAEDADFARAVEATPERHSSDRRPEVIELMGSKVSARSRLAAGRRGSRGSGPK